MWHKILIFLGVSLVSIGMAILQFAWYFEWYHNFEYAHEVGCILLYTGIALLLAGIALSLARVARALENIGQLMAMKVVG
ncbi:MAG: hypothetical protein DRJ96_05735 [Thermoprotei archaeon]|nr:MAG: hypothetical protein DRJ96_05735 [Thermoprotei archaeon]